MEQGVNSIDINLGPKMGPKIGPRCKIENTVLKWARNGPKTQANFSTVFSILDLGPIFGPKFMSIEFTPEL